jgi:hypothetical protein
MFSITNPKRKLKFYLKWWTILEWELAVNDFENFFSLYDDDDEKSIWLWDYFVKKENIDYIELNAEKQDFLPIDDRDYE